MIIIQIWLRVASLSLFANSQLIYNITIVISVLLLIIAKLRTWLWSFWRLINIYWFLLLDLSCRQPCFILHTARCFCSKDLHWPRWLRACEPGLNNFLLRILWSYKVLLINLLYFFIIFFIFLILLAKNRLQLIVLFYCNLAIRRHFFC